MKTIEITFTDAEYERIMMKANKVREDCKTHHREGYLLDAKTFLSMCARLNLKNNLEQFAKAVTMK